MPSHRNALKSHVKLRPENSDSPFLANAFQISYILAVASLKCHSVQEIETFNFKLHIQHKIINTISDDTKKVRKI